MGPIRITKLHWRMSAPSSRTEQLDARKPMDARDRAIWEDAEGSLYVPKAIYKGRSPSLRTTQLEYGILADYRIGALRDGVKCTILTMNVKKTVKSPRAFVFYETYIHGLVNISRELRLTSSYRRSFKLGNQIRNFKTYLWLPRKTTQRQVIEARELSKWF